MKGRRGGEFWVGMALGVALVAGWLAMVAYNAAPYFQGATPPPLSALLSQIVTPPALASVMAPNLAALAGWALAVVIVALAVTLVVSAGRIGERRDPIRPTGHLPLKGEGPGGDSFVGQAGAIVQEADAAEHLPLPAPVTPENALAPAFPPSPAPALVVAPHASPLEAGAAPQTPPVAVSVGAVAPAAPAVVPLMTAAGHAQVIGPGKTWRVGVRRVFVSHSSHDNDFGGEMVERLRATLGPGYDIWYDSKGRPGKDRLWVDGIAPATYWTDEIERAFTEADVFLVILSTAAMESPWVADELRLAWSRKNVNANIEKGLVVAPVLREECTIPPWLTLIQWVDFTGWKPGDWPGNEKLWEALESAVSGTRTHARPLELVGPPFNLDLLPPLERFIGREQAVEEVIALLTGDGAGGQQANVAAANGQGGMGKTALATEVARRLMGTRDFPDGIAVVKCNEQHSAGEARGLLRTALGRFTDGRKDPESDDLAELGESARIILRGKRALVVLDNVEYDLPAGQIIGALRNAGAAVLCTSRAPVAAMPQSATIRLDALPEGEAMELFETYFGRALSPDEERAARAIITALGRHTLATKLAAANAAALDRKLVAIAHDLETYPDKALLLSSSDEAVIYIMESSAAALSPAARRFFAALAAFATGDIGRMAATAVAKALGDSDPGGSLDHLLALRLADSGYLDGLPGGDKADREWVRLHPLVRQYARGLFDGKRTVGEDPAWTDAQRETVEHAIAAWFANYTNSAPDLALIPDEANITGALDWALDDRHDDRVAARICNGMKGFWRDTGRTGAGMRYLPLGAAAAGRVAVQSGAREDRRQQANITLYLGDMLKMAGRLDEAQSIYTEDLTLRRGIADRRGEGVVLSNLGQVAQRRGRLEEAERYYQQSLAIRREVSDRQGEGADLSQLGTIMHLRGQLDDAERYFEQGLAISREVSDRSSEGMLLATIGFMQVQRGQFDDAKLSLQTSLKISREVGSRANEGETAIALGQLGEKTGDIDFAESSYRYALIIFREVEEAEETANVLTLLGILLFKHRRREDGGQRMFDEAIGLWRQIGVSEMEERVRAIARSVGYDPR